MKYITYGGKTGQIVKELDASNDQVALEQAAQFEGVRVVKTGNRTVFEDWDHILSLDHQIFRTLRE